MQNKRPHQSYAACNISCTIIQERVPRYNVFSNMRKKTLAKVWSTHFFEGIFKCKCSANAECTRCQKHPRVSNLTWCLDRQVDVLMHLENSQFLNTLMAWCPTDAKQRAHQSVLMLLTKYHASNTCQCIVFTNRTITNQIHFNYHRIGFEDRFAHFPDRILRKWFSNPPFAHSSSLLSMERKTLLTFKT